jgi:hypothetical protein
LSWLGPFFIPYFISHTRYWSKSLLFLKYCLKMCYSALMTWKILNEFFDYASIFEVRVSFLLTLSFHAGFLSSPFSNFEAFSLIASSYHKGWVLYFCPNASFWSLFYSNVVLVLVSMFSQAIVFFSFSWPISPFFLTDNQVHLNQYIDTWKNRGDLTLVIDAHEGVFPVNLDKSIQVFRFRFCWFTLRFYCS